MSGEENKALVRAPGTPPGPESTKQVFATVRSALPDLRITVEDMVGEGDKVVARVTGRGTQKGEYMGIAPTGKQVMVTFIGTYRLEKARPQFKLAHSKFIQSRPKPSDTL